MSCINEAVTRILRPPQSLVPRAGRTCAPTLLPETAPSSFLIFHTNPSFLFDLVIFPLFTRVFTMIFGIELAFALVPLVITATEHHQRAYRKAKLVASGKARDEKLQDFLTELHDEVALLGNTLRSLISDLTTLTERQREQLLNYDQEEWNREEVNAALRARLGGESDLAFIDILDRLLKSLEDVVSEKSLNFVSSENVRVSGRFTEKLHGN